MTVAEAEERLVRFDQRLAVLTRAAPEHPDGLELQAHLVRVSLEMARPPVTQPFPLPREHLLARLAEGVPLLHDQPVQLDLQFAQELFNRLVSARQRHHQRRGDAPAEANLDRIAQAANAGRIDPEQLFGEAFVQHPGHLAELAVQVGVESGLLAALATQATAPLLQAYAEQLRPMVARASSEVAWKPGYCPICGGWPVLAEVVGRQPTRQLRCSACAASWRGPAQTCPFCSNPAGINWAAEALEAGHVSVSVCGRCTAYLKVRAGGEPLPAELVGLEDVATRWLDQAAIERGAHRPNGSGFRIELAVPEDEWIEELA